jgi:hypothetical protein
VENSFEEDLRDLLAAYFEAKLTDTHWDHCRPREMVKLWDAYNDLRAKFIKKYQPQEP